MSSAEPLGTPRNEHQHLFSKLSDIFNVPSLSGLISWLKFSDSLSGICWMEVSGKFAHVPSIA